jgi:hypothetical protein
MADFQYNPPEGWENETTFPDYPTAPEVRPLFQRLFNQIRDAFNTHKAEKATVAELGHSKVDGITITIDANGIISTMSETVNRTITVGVGKDFTTIQAAINSIKKRVDAVITVNVDAGTYNEDIIIAGFYGKGYLTINGGNSLATAVNYIVKSVTIANCMARVNAKGFTANTTTGIAFAGVLSMYPDFAWCRTVVSATSQIGFFTQNAFASISECEASNKNYGLYASTCSVVISSNWIAGSGNVVGLRALDGATIGKSGTQPQGTTAEQMGTGGIIR